MTSARGRRERSPGPLTSFPLAVTGPVSRVLSPLAAAALVAAARCCGSSSPADPPRYRDCWTTTQIGSGFPARTDPAALVIGPTGVGLGPNGVLYVADTLGNRIAGIPNAVFRGSSDGRGFTVSRGHHLNGELGLVIAPAVTS